MNIFDLSNIHFTGIKGVGMTALALCAQDAGIQVTGSDVDEVFVTDETLKKCDIKWASGFSADNLSKKLDLVITTGAHGGLENPEVLAAKQMGIPVMTHAQALGEFMKGKIGISVCGVGGKTTTSAMIAHILDRLGEKPSFAIGTGNIFSLEAPGRYNKNGKWFVAEADEYANVPGKDNTPRFNFQHPRVIVVTNIEYDHPDVYPTIDNTLHAFRSFFESLPEKGLFIANVDNDNVRSVLKSLTRSDLVIRKYGFDAEADILIKPGFSLSGRTSFDLSISEKSLGNYELRVPGKFNMANAAAAIELMCFLGFDLKKVAYALKSFTGTSRRFEKKGQLNGVLYYDDYAHHPIEIKATLKACREWFPSERIIVVFQPHTYSRTKQLLNEFASSFSNASIVGIMDIYASARENDTLGVSSELLTKEIQKNHSETYYIGGHNTALEWLEKTVKEGDIVITMGAGDVFRLNEKLI